MIAVRYTKFCDWQGTISLIGPISQDVGKAVEEYAKKNGYHVILDIGKFIDANSVLYFADAADITKDFITFYNARPATAAAPK